MATLLLLALAHLTSAHFGVQYPPWRSATMGVANSSYSQWVYPCAGVPGDLPNGNRTDWPLTGGSVRLDLRHDWDYLFINLGLGSNVSNFNYTLTPQIWNVTGKGILCVPEIPLPASLNVTDGTEASLQFVTVGDSGSALYNCADITFRASATKLPEDECKLAEGQAITVVNGAPPPADASAGAIATVNNGILSSVVALAVVFAYGMSL